MQQVGPAQQRRSLEDVLHGLSVSPSVISGVGDNGATSAAITLDSYDVVNHLSTGMLITGLNVPPNDYIIRIDQGTRTITGSSTITPAQTDVVFTFRDANIEYATLHLFSGSPTIAGDPTPASFTEAVFTGYVSKPVTIPNSIHSEADGTAEADFGLFEWVLATDPATPDHITGYWIDYVVNGVVVVAVWEELTGTLPMVKAGDHVTLSIPIRLPFGGEARVIGAG